MRKKSVILALAAAVMLACYFIIKTIASQPAGLDGYILHDHGGYITNFETAQVKSAVFVPANGEAFTISAKDNGFYMEDGCNAEELFITVAYAAALPFIEELGAPEAPLADYGLDPPVMTVTLHTANGSVALSIGGEPSGGGSAYILHDGKLYLADKELTGQLTLPKNAYRIRRLWPGEPGDRPVITGIATERFSVVRRDLDEDAPAGLSRYELTAPMMFLCNDSEVTSKVINGILAIDLDEIAENAVFETVGTVTIKAEGFERTLSIGGVTPEGWRYLMLDGDDTVYIDKLGDYGFLDVTPLDLTYGLAFWLYRFDDVKEITVTDGGRARVVPEGTSEINKRRFFSHVLNFSVTELALTQDIGADGKVTLLMNDGSVHELSFTKQNERQLAVSADGETPVFACNIKDWQLIIEDLELLEAGKSIREG